MKNVLVRIKQYSSTASSAEHGVLDFIISSPEEAAQYNVRQLADVAYTSPSTVVRLCKKLGFEGYRDLQKSLLLELAMRKQLQQKNEQYIGHSGQVADVVNDITYRNINSLEDSMQLVDVETVQKSVDLICQASSILLFGLGASYLVAQDAYLKFLRTGKPCSCCNDVHSQYLLARNAKPTDVAIIISYSGGTEEIIRCARDLQSQETPIIAITRFKHSALTQLATCCLYVVAMEQLFRSGAMSSRISQLNMIDILYTLYLDHNFSRNVRYLTHTQIKKLPDADS